MYQTFYKSNFAYIILQSNAKELVGVDFCSFKPKFQKQKCMILEQAKEELDLYFSNKLTKFEIPLLIQGSFFEKKVYQALLDIPYGQTKTYQEIASYINHPKAYRAVGNANAKNKLAIFIPCHRVVAKNHLGGYTGGLDIKNFLLQLEGAI
ncbi:methylated-DNA--[protein]-cysteine S-methyltransferase [Campylobacter peloridis]|uniref:methylated-DNA--[protein]-cysteine S-methyltransferase n=1 Tax=Campylobacter peloridis TaxID=488546 RepID=UPI001C72D8F2|nr:methylated-DNA--[protein]-cysteine S-methyltransferase [Campylobacter peloridis]MBX1886383.1 methylated-DNA--[protein]-cysteine S-methyltransferase [Campylobacter peloridis]MBX2079272.1 methylated-DNA--[protein]-cysteine S-methyltransferase [Campylobacter peloridis]